MPYFKKSKLMQKIHDKQNIEVLNKDKNQPCICMTVSPAAHPDPGAGSILHLKSGNGFWSQF